MRSRTVTAALLAVSAFAACSEPASLPWSESASVHATGGSADSIRVVVATQRGIEHVLSTDGGRSFGASQLVGTEPALRVGFGRGPRVASTSTGACVVAIAREPAEILAWTMRDGATWSKPVLVSRAPGAAEEGLHALASDGAERVFAAWVDLRAGSPEIWGARSLDGGASWSESRVYRSPSGSICPCCTPSVAWLQDGRLVVMFRNEIDGARDPWLAFSRDGGATFTPAEMLGTGSWRIAACPADGGSIARVDSGWISIWQRDGGIYTSSPGRPESELARGVLPALTVGRGGTWMAWQDARNGALLLAPPGGEPREIGRGVTNWSLCATEKGRPFVAFTEGTALRVATP